jgi:hypothetical protein
MLDASQIEYRNKAASAASFQLDAFVLQNVRLHASGNGDAICQDL